VRALKELRPNLQYYVPKLANLLDVLYNPGKLKTHKFKIELVDDADILHADPDSQLLINAFEYSEDSNLSIFQVGTQSSDNITPVSRPSLLIQKGTVIEASRLGLFDDLLTYFYLKKVSLLSN
jgi:hypothetical protein